MAITSCFKDLILVAVLLRECICLCRVSYETSTESIHFPVHRAVWRQSLNSLPQQTTADPLPDVSCAVAPRAKNENEAREIFPPAKHAYLISAHYYITL